MSVSTVVVSGHYTIYEQTVNAAVTQGWRVAPAATLDTVKVGTANDYVRAFIEAPMYGSGVTATTQITANSRARVVFPESGAILRNIRVIATGGIAVGDPLGPTANGALIKLSANFENAVAIARAAVSAGSTYHQIEVQVI